VKLIVRRAGLAAALCITVMGATARAASGRCDDAEAAQLLGVAPHDSQVACWRLDDGRRLLAAVPMVPLGTPKMLRPGKTTATPGPTPLVVRVALVSDAAVVWRSELRPDPKAAPELREVLEKSEEWLVGLDDQTLGTERGVRLGVVGHWGGDQMSVREIAFLFRLGEGNAPPRLVWSGLGNTQESRFDFCRLEGIATFQLVDAHTIERQLRVTPTFNRETKLARARQRQLEKQCVAKPQDPQRFPVTSG
jgi:hypothetical protein